MGYKIMNTEQQIKEKTARSIGWTQEFIEGNGVDADLWVSPDKAVAYHNLPSDFDEYTK